MNELLLNTIFALCTGALLGAIIGFAIGKRSGYQRARDDMELREAEAEWMREQRDFLEALK